MFLKTLFKCDWKHDKEMNRGIHNFLHRWVECIEEHYVVLCYIFFHLFSVHTLKTILHYLHRPFTYYDYKIQIACLRFIRIKVDALNKSMKAIDSPWPISFNMNDYMQQTHAHSHTCTHAHTQITVVHIIFVFACFRRSAVLVLLQARTRQNMAVSQRGTGTRSV